MTEISLRSRALQHLNNCRDIDRDIKSLVFQHNSQAKKLNQLKEEHYLAVDSLQALKDVRPLLAQSAIQRAEKLANEALQVIFDIPLKLFYSEEDARFQVETPEGFADFQEGQGGGVQAVVSFIFQVALLLKGNHRLFMVYDEMFTQLDDAALARFLEFVNKLCDDLGMQILLVTHDQRIQLDSVTHYYRIENGKSIKIK